MKKYGITALLTALALVRCSTDPGPVDTSVTVRLGIITATTPVDTIYGKDWDAFYFYGDTMQYHTPTWEDVRENRLRARQAGSTKTPDGRGEVLDTARLRFNHLTGQAILVILDPDSTAYAWRPLEVVDGLPEVALTFYFNERNSANAPVILNKWIIHTKARPAEPEEE